MRHLFLRPLLDVFYGEESCLGRPLDLLWLGLGLALGWWLYVPLHELLHAFSCLAAGGSVSELEIDAVYGGAQLAQVFPWVTVGSEYAGRLSGFDTGGSDLVYLVTDLGPFLLVLPGVWALRAAARAGRGFPFALTLPFALAPLLSLTGDAYEIGSILVTRVPPWTGETVRALLRGDDLFAKAGEIVAAGALVAPAASWTGYVLAAAVGVVWAFATYGLGSWLATRLGQPPLTRPASR